MKLWKALTTIAILLFIGLVSGYFYVANELLPTREGAPVRVTIPSGSSVPRIAEILEQKGLVRNHSLFTYYLRYYKEGSSFKAGEYEMAPGMSYKQLIEKMNNGETVKAAMLRFTIPEGYTIEQIARKLGNEQVLNEDAFLKLADTPSQVRSGWFDPAVVTKDVRHPLEGFLFPETYEMKKGSTGQEILDRLLAEWDRKLALLPQDWQAAMAKRGLSFQQLLTVSSLIEKEVAVEEERSIVASVIYNRLQKKMPLQIDATVQYALGDQKDRLFEKDLQIDSPYNTYKITGLPPGPIANPGIPSIKAALYPEETKFLYYVTKKDGSRGHLFAETYNEHLKNIELSKKEVK